MSRIIAAGFALALVIIAIQAGGALRILALAATARMVTGKHPITASALRLDQSLPSQITLNLNGGRFRCQLAGTGYTCALPVVRDAVRGPR